MWLKIVEITNEHYDYEFTTYAGVWRKYIYPVYPISYSTYISIINQKNIKLQLEREIERVSKMSADDVQGCQLAIEF
jgi:hypothetical protein